MIRLESGDLPSSVRDGDFTAKWFGHDERRRVCREEPESLTSPCLQVQDVERKRVKYAKHYDQCPDAPFRRSHWFRVIS